MGSPFQASSELETIKVAEKLSEDSFKKGGKVFIQLLGPLGSGKTTFARGFIKRWLELSHEKIPDIITSPSYNLIKIYGEKNQVAHLDLYRLKTIAELEQLDYEHYFYETPCTIVEWLDHIPQAASLRPPYTQIVEFCFDKNPQTRKIIFSD